MSDKTELAKRLMAQSGQQYLPNKFIDMKQMGERWEDDIPLGVLEFLGGMAVGTLPAKPVTGVAAMGLGIDGIRRVMMGTEGRKIANRLRYQGN